jgi:VanZ family protein
VRSLQRRRPLWLTLGWAWAGAIVWLSLTPSPPTVDFAESDKVGHFVAYGALMFWFSTLYLKRASRIAYAAGFIAMGIGLEFIQGWLGYRTYEVFDMLANTLGVLLGWAAALALRRLRAR